MNSMTVVVACRPANGTLVFGADQQLTSDDEIRDLEKLRFHKMDNGIALMGMAAEYVNLGLARVADLRIALNHVQFDQDPIIAIRDKMKALVNVRSQNLANEDVQILCGIASPALQKPKLLGICGHEAKNLDENRFCCIGSGAGAAKAFLRLTAKSLNSLRDVQTAVCTSVWLAKEVDSRCGGKTDIWWLNSDSSKGELDATHIQALEGYIETSLSETLARWIANAPFE